MQHLNLNSSIINVSLFFSLISICLIYMFKQIISIVEFTILYKILSEIQDILKFEIQNYESNSDFEKTIEDNKIDTKHLTIITRSINQKLIKNTKLDIRKILVFDDFPLEIEKLIEKINIQLIKQKYNFQSNFNINNYTLDLNSRIITREQDELKLTEREIDILLFLNENKKPQNVNALQSKVWGYSSELETHTVETHIYRLRKKIKEKFIDDNFIKSHKDGYSIK